MRCNDCKATLGRKEKRVWAKDVNGTVVLCSECSARRLGDDGAKPGEIAWMTGQ